MSTVVCWFERTLKQLEREQTDTQTDKTTTVTLAHARRGLIMCNNVLSTSPIHQNQSPQQLRQGMDVIFLIILHLRRPLRANVTRALPSPRFTVICRQKVASVLSSLALLLPPLVNLSSPAPPPAHLVCPQLSLPESRNPRQIPPRPPNPTTWASCTYTTNSACATLWADDRTSA